MATWTKSELADKVLERIGIKARSQAADAADNLLVQDAIDAKHDELAKLDLVPFVTSAIPTWAQLPMVKIMAAEVAPEFGFTGASLAEKATLGAIGKRDLQDQVQDEVSPVAVRVKYY